MMYRAIKFFTDKQDDGHAYNVGDTFPREGLKVSEKRIAELLGNGNRQKTPVIEKVESKTETFMNKPVQAEEPVQEIHSEEKAEVKKDVKRGRVKKNI